MQLLKDSCYNPATRRRDYCEECVNHCQDYALVRVTHTTMVERVVCPFHATVAHTSQPNIDSLGLTDYTWVGPIASVRWFGRFKYGQQWLSDPTGECAYEHIPNAFVFEHIEVLDTLQPDHIRFLTDKVVWVSTILDWAKKEGLVTPREKERLYRWFGNEELF